MTGDEAFLSRLTEQPEDDTTRLVYADWLEERGDPRAAYLRAEVELAGVDPEAAEHAERRLVEARRGLSLPWVARVGRPYDLVLRGYSPERYIQSIKLVRELTSSGLAHAKALVDSVPARVLCAVPRHVGEVGHRHLANGCLQVALTPSSPGTRIDVAVLEAAERDWPFPLPLPPVVRPKVPGPFDVLLHGYPLAERIRVIRVVRARTGMRIVDCRALVESAPPVVLFTRLSPFQAEAVRQELGESVQAEVVLSRA